MEKLMSPVHAGDRLTATAWLERIDTGSHAPSSNIEAQELPFQRWYRFKEAFSPRFVSTAIASLDRRPNACVDPFGGSGTTALTCQFLGVRPATIEVNPFLADLIEAKLRNYDLRGLLRDYAKIASAPSATTVELNGFLGSAPPTFVEPGLDDRWLFDKGIARRLLGYRFAIDGLSSSSHRALFRVLLGSIAVKLSNVVISGKGRRYRSNWQERSVPLKSVERLFQEKAEAAIQDISRFGKRAESNYVLLRGDSRELIDKVPEAEFSLFSPPYPNSFDYTDIYNVELWLLGYLTSGSDNRTLREATLRSHVQVKRSFECEPPESVLLTKTVRSLRRKRDELWDGNIPDMVQAYFADMARILAGLAKTMAKRADVMMVIGDSRYAGVRVDVASVCAEMAPALGFQVKSARPIRAMRASAQQGGHHILSETLLHLKR
ncbi:MAG: hypothetical protein WDM81_20905 [Rhizomicrobium sp.]